MTELDQKQLGKTLWNIADTLRGAMNADDFRDYMLSFLFLRYLSDNYEAAAKKELRADYPDPNAIGNGGRTPLSVWYADNLNIFGTSARRRRKRRWTWRSTHAELVAIDESIRKATAKHNKFLKELGLPPLP